MMSKTDELLFKADAAARKLQQKKYGRAYGIESSQVQGLIMALGEILDEMQIEIDHKSDYHSGDYSSRLIGS
jgi:hypothetical protein